MFLVTGESLRALTNPVLIPIYFTETQVAEVPTWPNQDAEKFSIEKTSLLAQLSNLLEYFYFEKLKNDWSQYSQINLRQLEDEGLNPHFDESALEIHLDIPLRNRKKESINFQAADNEMRPHFERPADWSGFLNVYTTETLSKNQSINSSQLDLVSNFKGYIFENKSNYSSDATPPWQRIESNITKDLISGPLKGTRAAAGDLNISPKGFQNVYAFLGGSIRNEQALHPQRKLASLSQQEIMITKPSRIEVYINNQIYSQFHIQPGKFNLSNLPISAGQNNIRVKVIDDFGQSEEFNIMYLFDANVLAEGENEFYYGGGQTADSNLSGKSYLQDSSAASFFHRYGWTQNKTIGLNFQSLGNQSLIGSELLSLEKWGIWGLDLASSQYASQTQSKAQAIRLSYRSINGISLAERPLYFSAQFEYRGVNFSQPQILGFLPSGSELQSLGQISYSPTDKLTTGIGGNLNSPYPGYTHSSLGQIFLNVHAHSNWYVDMSYNFQNSIVSSQYVLLAFNWTESSQRTNINSSYSSDRNNLNSSINQNHLILDQDLRLNAGFGRSDDSGQVSAGAEYLSKIARLRLSALSSPLDSSATQTYSVGLESSLAWAGGQLALSAPISDSFAIIKSDSMQEKLSLPIQAQSQAGNVILAAHSPVVLNHLAYEYPYRMSLDGTALPTGYLLNQEFFDFYPTYKTGYLIEINFQRKMVADGILILGKKPLAYQTGELFDENNKLIGDNFFTNKNGRFLIEALSSGKYQLRLALENSNPIYIDIPNEAPNNMIHLGKVEVKIHEE